MRVSYCDHSPSVGIRRPSTFPCLHSSIYKYEPITTKLGPNVYDHKSPDEFDYGRNKTRTIRVVCPWIWKIAIFDFVYTLASANIDQSVPNLATIYMPIRSQMSLIMGQIELELPELFALEFRKIAKYDLVYNPTSTNINQSAPNLVQMCMTIRARIEFDYGINRTRTVQVVCPWIWKFAIFDFVYTLASANIDQSVPNLATIYMPIRSQMSSIMGQIEPEHTELFALEFGKFAEYDSVYTLASTNINQSTPNLVTMYMSIRSQWVWLWIKSYQISLLSALEIEKLNCNSLFLESIHKRFLGHLSTTCSEWAIVIDECPASVRLSVLVSVREQLLKKSS